MHELQIRQFFADTLNIVKSLSAFEKTKSDWSLDKKLESNNRFTQRVIYSNSRIVYCKIPPFLK